MKIRRLPIILFVPLMAIGCTNTQPIFDGAHFYYIDNKYISYEVNLQEIDSSEERAKVTIDITFNDSGRKNVLFNYEKDYSLFWLFDYVKSSFHQPALRLVDETKIFYYIEFKNLNNKEYNYPKIIRSYSINYSQGEDEFNRNYDNLISKKQSNPDESTLMFDNLVSLKRYGSSLLCLDTDGDGNTHNSRTLFAMDLEMKTISSACDYDFKNYAPFMRIEYEVQSSLYTFNESNEKDFVPLEKLYNLDKISLINHFIFFPHKYI